MAQFTKDKLRGFLMPDPRFKSGNLWDSESSYTEASPVPGPASPTDSPRLRLATSGAMDGNDVVQVRCVESGTNARDSGRLAWKKVGDSDWRGWDPPVAAQTYEPLVWFNGTGTGAVDQFHAITTQAETALCAYRYKASATPTYDIKVSRTTVGGSTSQVTVASSLRDSNKWPQLLELPDGRLICYFVNLEPDRSRWQVRAYTSDDDGASWSLLNNGVIRDTWSSGLSASGTPPQNSAGGGATGYDEVNGLAVAYLNGQVCLFMGLRRADTGATNRHTLAQFASADLGCHFDRVEGESVDDTTAADAEAEPQLLSNAGELYLFFRTDSDFSDLKTKILTSAWQPSSEITDAVTYTTSNEIGWYTACLDDGGTVWIYTLEDSNGNSAYVTGNVLLSTDRLRTIREHGISGTQTRWWEADDGANDNAELTYIAATFHRGQVALYHGHSWSQSSFDKSLSVLYLGGWATVQLPSMYPTVAQDQSRSSWEWLWTPISGLPESDSRITAAGTATNTITASGLLQCVTTVGNQHDWYWNTANNEHVLVRATVRTTNTETGGQVGLKVVCSDGTTNDYDLELWIYASGFIVRDVNGSTTLATVSGLSIGSNNLHLLVAVNDSGGCSVWYKSGDPDGDLEYTEAYTTTSALTSGSGTTSQIQFGNIQNAALGSVTSQWLLVAHNSGSTFNPTGPQLGNGFDNPGDVYGCLASKSPMYLYNGLRVSSSYGPGIKGEQWSVDPKHTYAIENVFGDYSTSPREAWRTTADNVSTQIAVDYVGFADNTRPLSPLVGLYLSGINWKDGELQGYVQGSGWSTIMTIDSAAQLTSMPYNRDGNVLVPSSTTFTSPRYIHPGELIGMTLDLGSVRRKVIWNSGGYWTDDTTTSRPYILLDPDEVVIGDPNSGTFDVWYSDVLCVAHQGTTQYRGYRIQIDAQTTADGYYTIGQAVIGPFYPFSQDHSYGHTLTQSPNVTLTDSADWRRTAKKYSEERRTLSLAWQDGVDTRALHLLEAAHLQGVAASAVPHALRGDTPYLLQGLHRYLSGPATPLVYCAELDYDGSPWTVTDRSLTLYGRIVGDLEVSNVVGNEHNEVSQVNTVVIEEEL